MVPKRGGELSDGGSIYWVTKGIILVRQRIMDVREITDRGGRKACELVFDPELVAVEPTPKRAFQGWRYLKPEDAPADLKEGSGTIEMPANLRAQLREAMTKSLRLSSRDAIIEAAFTVFSKDPSASLSEVATLAGVGRATLHRHFAGREDLIGALAEIAIADMRAEMHPDRDWLKQRNPDTDAWEAITYGEGLRRTRALAQAFLDMGAGPDAPVMHKLIIPAVCGLLIAACDPQADLGQSGGEASPPEVVTEVEAQPEAVQIADPGNVAETKKATIDWTQARQDFASRESDDNGMARIAPARAAFCRVSSAARRAI